MAPEIREIGAGRWMMRWFIALALAFGHIAALQKLADAGVGDPQLLAFAACPAIFLALGDPAESLARWYRWPALWLLVATSSIGLLLLMLGNAWIGMQLYPAGPPKKKKGARSSIGSVATSAFARLKLSVKLVRVGAR